MGNNKIMKIELREILTLLNAYENDIKRDMQENNTLCDAIILIAKQMAVKEIRLAFTTYKELENNEKKD